MVDYRSRRVIRFLSLLLGFFLLVAGGIRVIGDLVDFPVYYHAGQSLLEGRTDLYAPDFAVNEIMDYRYPPLFLIVFLPVWMLPYTAAACVWFLFSVLLALGCFLLLRICADGSPGWRNGLLLFFAVGPYFVMAVHYGNAHLLLVFLLFGAFIAVFQHRYAWGAVFMGLGITIKAIPLLLLPYFVIKRKWKFLALTLVFVLIFNLLPAFYFGFETNLQILGDWFHHVTGENAAFHEIHGAVNQSLRGQLRRLLTDIDYSKRYDGHNHYPVINLASLSPAVVETAAWIVIVLLWILFLVYIFRRDYRQGSDRRAGIPPGSAIPPEGNDSTSCPSNPDSCIRAGLEAGLVICLLLLTGPLTSRIYMIALLWPAYFLILAGRRLGGGISRWTGLILLLTAAVNTGAPLVPSLTGINAGQWSRILLVLGADFYLCVLIFIAAWISLYAINREPAAGTPHPAWQSIGFRLFRGGKTQE